MLGTAMRGGRSSLSSLGLQPGESVDFEVRGECMKVSWNPQAVRVHRRRVYLPGDVVLVRRRDHWNAHRFLGYAPSARGLLVLTQADDSDSRDPGAPAGAIVGRVDCEVTARDRLTATWRYARALMGRAAGTVR